MKWQFDSDSLLGVFALVTSIPMVAIVLYYLGPGEIDFFRHPLQGDPSLWWL